MVTIDHNSRLRGVLSDTLTSLGTFKGCVMDSELDSLHMYDSADISASANIVKPKLKRADSFHYGIANLDDITLNAVVDLDPSGELYFDVREFMDTVTNVHRRPNTLSLGGAAMPAVVGPPPAAGQGNCRDRHGPVSTTTLSPMEQCVPAAQWTRDAPVDICQLSPAASTSRDAFPLDMKNESFIDMVSSTTGLLHAGTPPTIADNWRDDVSCAAVDSPMKTSSRKSLSRKRGPNKDSDEYRSRRARNNVAVRKSRDKAKQRHMDSESRVQHLNDENSSLRQRVELLSKELGVLRTLFGNVGIEWSSLVQPPPFDETS